MKALSVAAFLAAVLAATPAALSQEDEQRILTRGLLEALRANTEAAQRNTAALEALSGRLDRVETAVRNLPPSLEGLRTDLIAIRASVERIASGQSAKRPAATLRFNAFVCGNQTEQACTVSACRSVGYTNGVPITLDRRAGATSGPPVAVREATCYDG
jgi:hypothetical protein